MPYLFTYGILMRDDAISLKVKGEIRDLGPYPAARFDRDGVVIGCLREVTEDQLTQMDRIEGVPFLYTREKLTPDHLIPGGCLPSQVIRVATIMGNEGIWAYQYNRPDFDQYPLVDGIWTRFKWRRSGDLPKNPRA